jgi:non-ribosomal peptide synthetase component F
MSSQDLLSNLSAHDRELFWKYGQGEKVNVPFQCVHHAFEHQARSNPNLTAVEELDHKITYGELERKANCLAARLRGSGVNIGSRVCLLVERSFWLPIGYLGILKAGGAYIPLDGNVVSDSTLNHIIKDSAPAVILTLRKFHHRLVDASTEVVFLDEALCSTFTLGHCIKPRDLTSSSNSVYTLYTSGKSLAHVSLLID